MNDTLTQKHLKAQWLKDKSTSYYVYLHRRLSDNSPFYVGKGCSTRAWAISGRNPYWQRVAEKHGFYVDIVFESLTNEEALLEEISVIAELKYFGHNLCNLTGGGDGSYLPSDETRKKMSERKKGKSPYNKGKTQSATAGRDNPSADLRVHTFVHDSGEVFIGNRYDFKDRYPHLVLYQIGKLFYSKPILKYRGWVVHVNKDSETQT